MWRDGLGNWNVSVHMEWGWRAWSGDEASGETNEDQVVAISACQADMPGFYTVSNGEPLRVSEWMSVMIRADWDNFLAAGMKSEWEEDSEGGKPSGEGRMVRGVTRGMPAERREYI